jgi:hypothetical protein
VSAQLRRQAVRRQRLQRFVRQLPVAPGLQQRLLHLLARRMRRALRELSLSE